MYSLLFSMYFSFHFVCFSFIFLFRIFIPYLSFFFSSMFPCFPQPLFPLGSHSSVPFHRLCNILSHFKASCFAFISIPVFLWLPSLYYILLTFFFFLFRISTFPTPPFLLFPPLKVTSSLSFFLIFLIVFYLPLYLFFLSSSLEVVKKKGWGSSTKERSYQTQTPFEATRALFSSFGSRY